MLDALHTLYLNVKLSCEVSPAPHLLDEKKKKWEWFAQDPKLIGSGISR